MAADLRGLIQDLKNQKIIYIAVTIQRIIDIGVPLMITNYFVTSVQAKVACEIINMR